MNSNIKRIPLGESDFRRVVSEDYYYVDKTLLIKEIIDQGDTVLLIPRPRRFGKTLNISMLKYFYDCCPEIVTRNSEVQFPTHKNDLPKNDYSSLFDHLNISHAGEEYLEKMGKHPVIFLTFKNIKESDWETTYRKIIKLIRQEYSRHLYILKSDILKDFEVEYFKQIIDLKAERDDFENSLEMLLIFLNRYYKERVVILIDEYDAPIHSGFSNDYYDEVISFMRNFLTGGLKDTGQYLEKGVLTGILRIARESIFSGLNNIGVYTLLSDEFCDKFGFTQKEVEIMLKDFNLSEKYDEVQRWYNGYIFGTETIYNPWSIISFLNKKGKVFQPFWINTASNEIIESFLSKGGKELKSELEQLIQGQTIEKVIDENIVMKDIGKREDLLWSFLLMTGYLKQSGSQSMKGILAKKYYTLSIPNKEVSVAYHSIIENYFSQKVETSQLEAMLKALLDGDIVVFEKILRKVVLTVFSYHDFGWEPEKVYHALVLGFLVWISESHEIKSNRESGYGRYDVCIIPRDVKNIGYVIEFKTLNSDEKETVESAVESALKQIEEKKYETELIQRGITYVKKLAIVFNGKEIYVRE